MTIYKDASKPVGERVADLLSRMTLKEKVGQLNQKMHGWNAYKIEDDAVHLIEEFKNEVAFGDGIGAIYGISRADGWNSHLTMGISARESIKVANAVQQYIIDNTRLGIPLLLAEECPHGHEALESTTFPTNIGMGSSWNPSLYEEVCSQIGREIKARGAHLGLISTLDITTDPRWGRTEECYSEDPFLSASFSEKAVKGLQDRGGIAAVVKHFCGQGATIGGHNGKSTNIGPRELREIHLSGMAKAAKAGAWGCMAAYNDLDGVPCHINKNLLTGILREEMGFKGFVMSDGLGVDRLKSITGDLEKAGAYAVKAGVDLNLWNESFLHLESAVANGYVGEEEIDLAVSRILRVKFELGLFENPFTEEKSLESHMDRSSGKNLALQMAREVPVLLKNESILPLKSQKTIAVIGPNSDNIYNMLGDYTQWQEEGKVTTILEGIKNHAPDDSEILWAKGCSVRGMDKEGFDEALEVGKKSDVIILVLGGSSTREPEMTFENNGALFLDRFTSEIDCGEAVDLADVTLGGVQQDLFDHLYELGKPIVTVLIQGRPHAVPEIAHKSAALLCGWYPGEEGGNGIGEILFGKTNPSGKLSVSVPRSSAQIPVYYNRKDEGPYVDLTAKPLYPFGYGLSFTTFVYSDFDIPCKKLALKDLKDGHRFKVKFSIENQGKMDGKETAQLYIHDMESCVTRRIKELKDFQKLHITRGSSAKVELSVGLEELSVYDYNMNFVLEPGHVKLMVGSSSELIHFEEVVEILHLS